MKIRFRNCSTKASVEFDPITDVGSEIFIPEVCVVVFRVGRAGKVAGPRIVSSVKLWSCDKDAIGYADALQLGVFVFQDAMDSDLFKAFDRLKVMRPSEEFIGGDYGVRGFPTIH